MKALIQRVSNANVEVDGRCAGSIEAGLLVLLGVRPEDGESDAAYLAHRLINLRVFPDEAGHMNRSLKDTGGALLLVSQFTLYADTRKGHRPGLSGAAAPKHALKLYETMRDLLRSKLGEARVATGEFGAHMHVSLVNDGPVTLEISSERRDDGSGR